jgi:ComF family protein
MKLDKVKERLISFIFPKKCIFCGKVISVDNDCCDNCRDKLPVEYIRCYARGPYRCVASFPYSGMYRKTLLKFKYKSKPVYGKQMAAFLAKDIQNYYDDVDFDLITAVPLHKSQLTEREYNQSEIIAREVARLMSVPYKEVLTKYRNNKRQHTLKGKARAKNVSRVYKVEDKKSVKDKNILIIDDVITTGCTLGACSKVVFKAGANLVCTAAFCSVEVK